MTENARPVDRWPPDSTASAGVATREWSIKEVARATGLTSRTLRHYEQIGLLHPSRVADNGYRFYDEAALSRLYRIISLRAIELPLAAIQLALADHASLAEAIQSHADLLADRLARTHQQVTVVKQTLTAVQRGHTMNLNEVFASANQDEYEPEVRQRWGDDAWERSANRRRELTADQLKADIQRSIDLTARLRAAAESGLEPASEPFQALIADHYRWITEQWGGQIPDRDAYAGLSYLYVTDLRFSAAYGGQANAEIIQSAILSWTESNLS